MLRRAMSVVACLLLAVGGCSQPGRGVQLTVTPATMRMDEPVAVRVSGLEPGASVDLVLSSTDTQQVSWTAAATFVAGADGTVDPATTAPATGGSYAGVDAMGLMSSLTPGGATRGYTWPDSGPASFVLTARQDGRDVASTTFGRTFWTATPTVRHFTVAKDGWAGTYLLPNGAQRGPAVVVLGGSEGGDPVYTSSILAARGIPALSVAYFGATDLPAHLEKIPLEYFDAPIRWLSRRPEVDPARLWISGGSRGSEAAALVAADRPDLVHGLIDLSPSSVVHCAYVPGSHTLCPDAPAWTHDGKAVPHTTQLDVPDPIDAPDAVIDVEKIDGPVLTLCGGADQLWDSCRFSESIQQRLADHHFTHPRLALSYPDAGHFIDYPMPYQPSPPRAPGSLPTFGSTPLANELARAEAWPKVLDFVETAS